MICFVEMVNCSTGEMYYSKKLGFAFNIGLPNDVGIKRVNELIQSVIRGARVKHEPLQLRLMFNEPLDSPELPFQPLKAENPDEAKPF